MTYLYHIVPKTMVGTRLVPLNAMKASHPKLYKAHKKKYQGREQVMNQYIPPLDCLWNDVVFMTAVMPADLANAYKSAGAVLHKRRFYQIDPAVIDAERATIWLFKTHSKGFGDFVPFRPEELVHHSSVSAKTVEYYKAQASAGKPALMFAFIPHILFKGEINVSAAPIIEV